MAVSTDKLTDTKGILLNRDAFVIIVKTEWNAHVVDLLEEGCINILTHAGVGYKVIEVPGAFEIPFAIKAYNENAVLKPDAYIALGCVIRGATPHFEYICTSVSAGIMQLNLNLPVPVIFGVLTVNDQVEADERTGGRHGHKGEEAAATAVKMIALSRSVKDNSGK